MAALRIGLVGAGPWARMGAAPTLARHPDVELVGVWARRRPMAEQLATDSGTVAVGDFAELLDRSEALCFSVPPDAQAELAVRAVQRGRHVLLDKPIALSLEAAKHLAAEVDRAGIVSQVLLTLRYLPAVRALLEKASTQRVSGGRISWINGALRGSSPFNTAWRQEQGVLMDVGPHVLDLLDAALGPVLEVRATQAPAGVLALTCVHGSGSVSQALVSTTAVVAAPVLQIEVYAETQHLVLEPGTGSPEDAIETALSEFVQCVRRGTPHALDVHRGVHLQALLSQAGQDLRQS